MLLEQTMRYFLQLEYKHQSLHFEMLDFELGFEAWLVDMSAEIAVELVAP